MTLIGRTYIKKDEPTSIDEVHDVLGVSSFDEGTLCTSDRINHAALYCPRYSAIPSLELNDVGFAKIKAWGQTSHTNYGCPAYGVWVPKLPVNNIMVNNLSTLFDRSDKIWLIERPDATSYYIIDHFRGYDHTARIVDPVISADVTTSAGNGCGVTVTFIAPAADGKALSIANLFGGGDWYFGFVAVRSSTPDYWSQTDPNFSYAVVSSNVKVAQNLALKTGVQVTYADNGADTDIANYYHIIPFICSRPNILSIDGVGSSVGDTEYYGLRIDETCRKRLAVGSNGSTSGTAGVDYFNWKEGSNGTYYPVPGDCSYSWLGGSDSPYIAIAYKESDASAVLREIYYMVEMVFRYYDKYEGVTKTKVYRWTKDATDEENTLKRDSRWDNTTYGGNLFFFYLTWADAITILNNSDEFGVTLTGKFRYLDDNGYPSIFSMEATYIPNLTS